MRISARLRGAVAAQSFAARAAASTAAMPSATVASAMVVRHSPVEGLITAILFSLLDCIHRPSMKRSVGIAVTSTIKDASALAGALISVVTYAAFVRFASV
jgi:hypothetical protein